MVSCKFVVLVLCCLGQNENEITIHTNIEKETPKQK